MAKRKVPTRTAERIIRNAYDLDELAVRFLADGHDRHYDTLKHITKMMHALGRRIIEEAETGE